MGIGSFKTFVLVLKLYFKHPFYVVKTGSWNIFLGFPQQNESLFFLMEFFIFV